MTPAIRNSLLLTSIVLALPTFAPAATILLPTAIQPGAVHVDLQLYSSGYTAPVTALAAPGNTADLFVVDQTGKITVIHNGVPQATPFLDITAIETNIPLSAGYDERGLLSVAFDPNFNNAASPGFHKVYTYHSEKTGTAAADFVPVAGTLSGAINHQNVLTEWTASAANPLVIDTSTRRDILREDHPALNHNGGTIAFGNDGLLYMAIGDGGTANDAGNGHIVATGNAQVLNNIMGKVLRIDPHGNNSVNGKYGIPADNPFVATAGAMPEIYAYGFRNPYKFSFDAATGKLFVADVGQNNVEEVDNVVKGGNYGWAVKEGTFLFNRTGPSVGTVNTVDSPGSPAGLLDPMFEYDHNDGIAIVGGFVYHGSRFPQLQGKYIFGDFTDGPFSGPGNGRLFYADPANGAQIFEFNLNAPLGLFLKGIGQDANGELYALASTNLGPSGSTGVVLALVPEPASLTLLTLASIPLVLRGKKASIRQTT